MKQSRFEIITNREIAGNTFEMVLAGDTSELVRPGQFVNIRLDGYFLRRPISVCDWTEPKPETDEPGKLTLIYKVVGHGTEAMSKMIPGRELDLLIGLGNGYDTACAGARPLLIGGGAGIPPMFGLAKELIGSGTPAGDVSVILGFNTADEVFYGEEFRRLGVRLIVMTMDGSSGRKGTVADAMRDEEYTHFFTCGPYPMFRAIEKIATTSGQYSFEERMGCGFGACMGCSCETKYGSKRICKDGPVLKREEIIW